MSLLKHTEGRNNKKPSADPELTTASRTLLHAESPFPSFVNWGNNGAYLMGLLSASEVIHLAI